MDEDQPEGRYTSEVTWKVLKIFPEPSKEYRESKTTHLRNLKLPQESNKFSNIIHIHLFILFASLSLSAASFQT